MTNRVSQRGIKVIINSIPSISSNPFIKCDKHYKIFHNIISITYFNHGSKYFERSINGTRNNLYIYMSKNVKKSFLK